MHTATLEPHLTLKQALAVTGYGPTTIRKAVRSGQLAAVRLGANPRGHLRFRQSELARWMAAQEIPARATAR